jgi:hypothetical protein
MDPRGKQNKITKVIFVSIGAKQTHYFYMTIIITSAFFLSLNAPEWRSGTFF